MRARRVLFHALALAVVAVPLDAGAQKPANPQSVLFRADRVVE